MSHDPEKVVFDFSSYELSDEEISLLYKGLNFSIPPKPLDYADHMLSFKVLFRDINKNEMPEFEMLQFDHELNYILNLEKKLSMF